MVVNTPSWVSVQKVRYSQLYQIFPEFPPQPVDANEGIENGCSVELTRLSIRENPWWSLAFEASGQEACLMDNLQKTANWVFKTYHGSKLLAADSLAYPSWLELPCQQVAPGFPDFPVCKSGRNGTPGLGTRKSFL